MRLGFVLLLLLTLSFCPFNTKIKATPTDLEVFQAVGYVTVVNRSYSQIRVFINGYDAGYVNGGYSYSWQVPSGMCHKVEAWWPNNYYNVWQACPGYGQTIICNTY